MNSAQCFAVKRYVLAGKIGSQVIHPKTWLPVVTIKRHVSNVVCFKEGLLSGYIVIYCLQHACCSP